MTPATKVKNEDSHNNVKIGGKLSQVIIFLQTSCWPKLINSEGKWKEGKKKENGTFRPTEIEETVRFYTKSTTILHKAIVFRFVYPAHRQMPSDESDLDERQQDVLNAFIHSFIHTGQDSSFMIFQHLKFEDNKRDENWKPVVFFAGAFKPACIFLSKIKK